jgi:hypothetical protein
VKYLIEVDDELWRKFKAKCALEGILIKDIFIELIERWISEETKKAKRS